MKTVPAMKAILFASVVSLSLQASANSNGVKIVGGEAVTKLSEVPYMVSLSGSCGGSIIASKWVLTAAHCAGHFSNVKAGVLNLKETGRNFKIKRTIKHPKYNPSTMTHDFALVELEDAIDFKKTKLQAIKLATKQFEADGHQNPGMDSTVYGFGNLGSGQSNVKKDLNKVIVPIVSNETANAPEAYAGQVDETMIAAGYAAGGKDSCQGDSGGPLVVFDGNNEPVQIGVVSWGEGCADPDKYGVYSKVSFGQEWIQETISK